MTKDVRVTAEEFEEITSRRQKALTTLNQNFAIGETLTVREFDPQRVRETDRVEMCRITHVKPGSEINKGSTLSANYVVLSLEPERHANGEKV